jgi:hypothetical protein
MMGVTFPPEPDPSVGLHSSCGSWRKGHEQKYSPEEIVNKLREADVLLAKGQTLAKARSRIRAALPCSEADHAKSAAVLLMSLARRRPTDNHSRAVNSRNARLPSAPAGRRGLTWHGYRRGYSFHGRWSMLATVKRSEGREPQRDNRLPFEPRDLVP